MGIREQVAWAWSLVTGERQSGARLGQVARDGLRHALFLSASGFFYWAIEPAWNRGLLGPYQSRTGGKTYLQPQDFAQVRELLQVGDILAGRSEASPTTHMIHWFGHSEWTHVGIYVGDGIVVEALDSQGVTSTSVEEFLGRYTRAALYRVEGQWDREAAAQFAKAQIGKRYNFAFAFSDGQFYCSQLVYRSLQAGGNSLPGPEPDFFSHPLLRPDSLVDSNGESMRLVWMAQREMFATPHEAFRGLVEMGIELLKEKREKEDDPEKAA